MTALQKTKDVFFHSIFTDMLLSSKDRDEEWFQRCQQVCVYTNLVGDIRKCWRKPCFADVQTPVEHPFTCDASVRELQSVGTSC